MKNQLWRLLNYPQNLPTEEHLAFMEESVPELGDGDVLIRIVYVSMDPANRLWIRPEGSYLPAFPLGSVMPAASIGIVEASRHPRYSKGQRVQGIWGWQLYTVLNGGPIDRQLPMEEGGILPLPAPPPGTSLLDFFGLFGVHGLTAYFGVTDIGQVKPGDTMLVSAAAGAIGSLVVQMAKISGARVIGIAGGPEKCSLVTDKFGADACIDYKSDNMSERIASLAPGGVDVYFDNVGGDILEAAIDNMAHYGRIVFCGAISQYNQANPGGPSNYMQLLYKEVTLKGFLVLSYIDRMEEAMETIAGWMAEDRISMQIDLQEGLENALAVFNRLFDGTNRGKLVLQVSDPE